MPTETLRPTADVTNSLVIFGGEASLFESWNDLLGSGDATGAEENAGFTENGEVRLNAPVGIPDTSVNWTLFGRARFVDTLPANIDVRLKQGAVQKATFAPTVTASYVDYSLSFDPSLITAFADLRIRVDAAADVNPGDKVQISDVKLVIATLADPPGDSDTDARGLGKKLGRPEKPEGESPAEQSATLTTSPKAPQFKQPGPRNLPKTPGLTISKIGVPQVVDGVSEGLVEEDREVPVLPRPMQPPPLRFKD